VQSLFGNLTVTLYDFFGYLNPGLVALSGIGLFFWAVFVPDLKPDGDLSTVVWIALFLIAYFLGHLVQAIAGYVPGFKYSIVGSWWSEPTVGAFRPVIEAKLNANGLLPTRTSEEEDRDVQAGTYRICDVVVTQKAATSEHELFTYREGFYRGMSVALLILAIGLWARILRGPATITLDKDHTATRAMLFFFLIATLVAAYLYFLRFERFARLKGWTVLLGAPTSLTESSTNAEEPEAVTRAPQLEIYPDTSGKYRWRLRAANNEIVASSGQDFASKSGAREAAETLKRTSAVSEIVEIADG